MTTDLEMKALGFAIAKHGAQKRKYTGEPYVNHVVNVARLVKDHGGTPAMIAAALLHDTMEDTDTTFFELREAFGLEIARLVSQLTDVYTLNSYHGNRATRKKLERERLATVSAEAQTIKVADMIDNVSTILKHDPDFALIYLTEKSDLLEVLTKADAGLLAKAKEINHV